MHLNVFMLIQPDKGKCCMLSLTCGVALKKKSDSMKQSRMVVVRGWGKEGGGRKKA